MRIKLRNLNQNNMEQTIYQEHSEMVLVLAKPGEQILKEMTPEQMHLLHMAIGVSGEAGELIDAIKKVSIYQKNVDIANVIEELGDLEFYMEGIRSALGVTRERTLRANIEKLGKRYHDKKYSNQQAQERADKSE